MERPVNNFQTTVAGGGYTSGSGSLTVTSASGVTLGSGDSIHLLIYTVTAGVLVPVVNLVATALSTNTFTVTAEGADASASAGDIVICVWSVGALAQTRSDAQGIDTYANLPATTNQLKGNRFKCTDSDYEFIFNGTAWVPFVAGIQVVVPPAIAGWTTINTTPDIVDGARGPIFIETNSTGGYVLEGYRRATATTPPTYTAILGFKSAILVETSNQYFYGLFVDNGTTAWGIFTGVATSGNNGLWVINFTLSGGYGGSNPIANVATLLPALQYKWVKFVDDGTNWTVYVSINRQNWLQVYQTARSSGYGHVGFGLTTQNSITGKMSMEVFDFQEGT